MISLKVYFSPLSCETAINFDRLDILSCCEALSLLVKSSDLRRYSIDIKQSTSTFIDQQKLCTVTSNNIIIQK